MPELRTPPLTLVSHVQRVLSRRSIPSAVGGSGLLASLGLIGTVNDWDLVADAQPAAVEAALDELSLRYSRAEQSGVFRTQALFTIDAGDHQIDVLVRFALQGPNGVIDIPARLGHWWRGLQMAEPEDWYLAYRLMGRQARAELLENYPQNLP